MVAHSARASRGTEAKSPALPAASPGRRADPEQMRMTGRDSRVVPGCKGAARVVRHNGNQPELAVLLVLAQRLLPCRYACQEHQAGQSGPDAIDPQAGRMRSVERIRFMGMAVAAHNRHGRFVIRDFGGKHGDPGEDEFSVKQFLRFLRFWSFLATFVGLHGHCQEHAKKSGDYTFHVCPLWVRGSKRDLSSRRARCAGPNTWLAGQSSAAVVLAGRFLDVDDCMPLPQKALLAKFHVRR